MFSISFSAEANLNCQESRKENSGNTVPMEDTRLDVSFNVISNSTVPTPSGSGAEEDSTQELPVPKMIFKIQPAQNVDQSWSIAQLAQNFTPWSWEEVFADAIPEIEHASRIITRFEEQGQRFLPLKQDVFNAFKYTALFQVKVVIVGQDPYPTELNIDGQLVPRAMGLSFSVRKTDDIPPSLVNIYKEIESCIPGWTAPDHGDLTAWATQGVLLLNTIPTFRVPYYDATGKKIDDNARVFGPVWKPFIKKVLSSIYKVNPGCIFVLWGNPAQSLLNEKGFIADTCPVLKSPHPSPMSAYGKNGKPGFFGNRHFAQINELLIKQGKTPIDWTL